MGLERISNNTNNNSRYSRVVSPFQKFTILFGIIPLLLLLLLCPNLTYGQDDLEVPPNKFYIDTPTFSQDRLDLFLDYPISDGVPFENLGFKVYDGIQCAEGASDITYEQRPYLSVELLDPGDGVDEGDGNTFYQVRMAMTFDPDTIRTSPIFYEEGLRTLLKFCVRLGSYSAPSINPAAVEIFYKQTAVTVEIRQEGDTEVEDFVISPDDITDETATQLYRLEGWLCHLNNTRLYDPIPIFVGMPTRVCVTPDAEARAAGVYMRAIDSFYWTRDTIYQTAIFSHQEAAPLTEIECEAGMLVCAFTTILKAKFFFKRGIVDGAGIGWLQVRPRIERGSKIDFFSLPKSQKYNGFKYLTLLCLFTLFYI